MFNYNSGMWGNTQLVVPKPPTGIYSPSGDIKDTTVFQTDYIGLPTLQSVEAFYDELQSVYTVNCTYYYSGSHFKCWYKFAPKQVIYEPEFAIKDLHALIVNTCKNLVLKRYPDIKDYVLSRVITIIENKLFFIEWDGLFSDINDYMGDITESWPVPNPNLETTFMKYMPAAGPSVASMSHKLPGMDTIVECPCADHACLYKEPGSPLYPVRNIIIHLNDSAGWTREEIADWIDRLHDSGIIDAEFKSPEETAIAAAKELTNATVNVAFDAAKLQDAFEDAAEKVMEMKNKLEENYGNED